MTRDASLGDQLTHLGQVAAGPAHRARRLVPRPLTDRGRGWVVALSLAMIAGLVRLWNLGYPTDKGTPVFDEKHYVPQAWQMIRNGGVEDNPG
ncbi:MAG: dolichyl-phosphate-mannose--protein mannosyltransferase, partial [Pseudonocardiaceae bacterium]